MSEVPKFEVPGVESTSTPNGCAYSSTEMLPQVYDKLRELADRWMARESPDFTLQPTSLVHEAYLRMSGQRVDHWQGRTHFFAVAAQAMRRVLIDHARQRRAAKRGGGWSRVTLSGLAADSAAEVDLDVLNEALDRLNALNPRHCRIIELRFLGGCSVQETAESLGVSPRTVKLDWRMARAWLLRELEG